MLKKEEIETTCS